MRFINVGHPDARMEDLKLDFREKAGQATDSTLWLRNGGGKSSILNLFFALVRPNRREFLGRQSETRKRRLEDYVTARDHSVVVCEWELDEQGALLDLGQAQRYLTGVFYERQSAQDDELPSLRRSFFAALVSSDDPRLSMDGLPLFTNGERPARRTLASFRQEWLALRDMYPHAEVMETDNQAEWQKHLESRGIDSELFYCQIQMNEHEGGADKLFQFKEPEDFADFLLELAMDCSHADDLRRNIATFREQLAKRKEQFLPEIELCDGLLERLGPMVEVAQQRKASLDRAYGAKSELLFLDQHLGQRIAVLLRGVEHLDQEQRQVADQASQARRGVGVARRHAAALRQQGLRVLLENAEEQLRKNTNAYEQANRRRETWRAAIPLRKAKRFEALAADYRAELSRKMEAHAPLLADLTEAASRLWAALSHQATSLRESARSMDAQKRESRDMAKTCRETSRQFNTAIAEAAATARSAEAFLKACEDQQVKLVGQQILLVDEAPVAGEKRLDATLKALQDQHEELIKQALAVAARVQMLTCERDKAVIARTEATAGHGQIQSEITEYSTLRSNIAGCPDLLRLLDLEQVDLESLAERVLASAQEEAGKALGQLLLRRMEQAADQRAIAHLEKESLLPPTIDAAVIRDQLHQKLPAIWTGWQYIAETRKDNNQRRDMARRLPHLATGVVVRDSDFDKACELLRAAPPVIEMPVFIAPTQAFEQDSALQGHVVLPTGDGLYDRAAGVEELVRRQERAESIEGELASLEAWRKAMEELLGRVREFRRRYPKGWLSGKQADLEAARLRKEDLTSKVAKLEEQAAELDGQHQQNKADQQTLQAKIMLLRENMIRLRSHIDQYDARRAEMQQQVKQARQQAEKARSQQKSVDREAEAAEHLATDLEERARQLGEDARTTEQARDDVEYVAADRPEPAPGAIPDLQDRYNHLRSQYLYRVGANELQKLAEAEDKHAAEEREEFHRLVRLSKVTPSLSQEEVETSLAGLGTDLSAEEMVGRAEDAINQSRSAMGTDTQRKQRFWDDLQSASAICQGLGQFFELTEAEAAFSPEGALEESEQLSNQAQVLEQEATAGEASSQELSQRAAVQRQMIDGLEKDQERLGSIRGSNQDLLDLIGEIDPGVMEWTTPQDTEITQRFKELEARLKQFREASIRLDQERDKAAHATSAWLQNQHFEGLKTSIRAKFAELDAHSLEFKVVTHLEDLTLRRRIIQDQLDELDKHRALLVENALHAADEGLSLLRRASSQSLLPEDLPGLGGTRFLDIRTRQLQDPVERRSCIAGLIDDLIDAGDIPGGLELVQQAVRRLARPIRVRVLHPDPDRNREMVDIVDLGRLSGGEQLTCSVLLYCTLAQLRARSRGISRKPSSVLLLDNPIGRASRARFLDMQREVARTMGVQLIYTTAVNDHEALRTLPNVIRLKNERQDRNTGHRVVETDGNKLVASAIEATRIVREEPQLKPDGPSSSDKKEPTRG